MAHVLKQTEHIRSLLTMSMENVFCAPVERFVVEHEKDLREKSKRFEQGREHLKEVMANQQKITTAKKVDEGKAAEASGKVKEAKILFMEAAVDYVTRLYETEAGCRSDFLDSMNSYLMSYLAFFQQGMDLLSECEPIMDRLSMLVRVDKRAFEREKEDAQERLKACLEHGGEVPEMGHGATAKDVKEGYLYKQSRSGFKDWKKRWFVVRGGMMYYYSSYKDLKPQGIINLLYSSVRPVLNASKKNTFQVVTNQNRTYILHGEDMNEWIEAIQQSTMLLLDAMTPQEKGNREKALEGGAAGGGSGGGAGGGGGGSGGAGAGGAGGAGAGGSEAAAEPETPMEVLMKVEANRTCADCGAPDPEWASINLGIVICIECSGIHRSLGTHISKVRGVKLDSDVWDAEMLAYMTAIGNAEANAVWEGGVSPKIQKPAPKDTLEIKKEWVTEKYAHRRFIRSSDRYSRVGISGAEAALAILGKLNLDLYESVAQRRPVVEAYTCMAMGADVNWRNPADEQRSPLHAACADPHGSLVTTMLLLNGAKADALDEQRWSPLHVAAKNNSLLPAKLLLRNSPHILDLKTAGNDNAIDIATAHHSAAVENLLLSVKMSHVTRLMEAHQVKDLTVFSRGGSRLNLRPPSEVMGKGKK